MSQDTGETRNHTSGPFGVKDATESIAEAAEQARVLMADATEMLQEVRQSFWWKALTKKAER